MDTTPVTGGGPGAVYPAKRTEEWSHLVTGIESFVIREYRADGLVIQLVRVYPCILVGALGEDLIWDWVRQEFLASWAEWAA